MNVARARAAAWVLVGISVACVVGLDLGLIYKLDRWDALPYAALAHGAILPAVAAAGIAWRWGSWAQQVVSTILAAVVLLVWLHTWLGPVQQLAAWIAIQWYLWLGV